MVAFAMLVMGVAGQVLAGLSAWLGQLASRVHTNIAGVALANKMAHVAWALLAKSEAYRPPLAVVATVVAGREI